MEILKLNCRRFDEVNLYDLLNDSIKGVYIIWDGRSQKKPTYIGQGDLMNRLYAHRDEKDKYTKMKKFAKPIDGYVIDIIENRKKYKDIDITKYNSEIKGKTLEQNAKLVEFVMLYLADQNGFTTTKNISKGIFNALEKKFLKNNRTLKIHISGYNPFINVNNLKQLKEEIIIKFKIIKNKIYLDGNYRKLFKIKY